MLPSVPAERNRPADVLVAPSLEAAIATLQADASIDTIHIIGGGEVYREALQQGLVDRVFLTAVQADPLCDTFLPDLTAAGFESWWRSDDQVDASAGLVYHFEVLDSKRARLPRDAAALASVVLPLAH